MNLLYSKFYITLTLCLLIGLFCLPLDSIAQTEDEIYNEVKVDILCTTFKFLVPKEDSKVSISGIRCENIDILGQSIPQNAKESSRLYRVFKSKAYNSFGKAKLIPRLDKLIDDIKVELFKLKPRDNDWQLTVNTLINELRVVRETSIERIQKGEKRHQDSFLDENPNTTNDNTSNQAQTNNTFLSQTEMIIVIIIGLGLAGGIVYLVLQNTQLKTQLEEMEDFFQERYSRLDNRIDTKTSVQDYQSLMMKFNFMNEQLNASMHEISVLRNRNKNKISAEELVAKRTEHLESYEYNPSIQVYYTKFRPDLNMFLSEEFKTEPSRDSIFKIEVNLADPREASFKITDRSEYHQIALANPENMLQPCEYLHEPYNDDKIINLEHGLLEKKEKGWVIIKKAKIAFE